MRLFRKKDEEEIDEEELIDEKLPSKRFRDLKPENRKKRKEPPKPWGKKERLVVLFVFAGTIVLSGILAASARSWKLPGLPKLTMPSFNLLKEETIILSGGKPPFDSEKKARRVIGAFNEKTKNLSGVYGLYVVEIDNKVSYGTNHTQKFQAASLIKLPVIVALYRQAEEGNIDLDTKYTLKENDKVSGSGSLSGKKAGTVLTYRQLATLMGKESDNTAFGIVRKVVGDEKINELINEVGMSDTSLTENVTTPQDIGIFFEKLWNSELVNEENKNAILDSLTDTIYEDWLAKGIPAGVRIAHKYGREVHVVNDAGIVFGQHPFVVVIMSDGVVESEADEIFPTLSKVVYEEVIKE